jgi:hypothetical protein
MEDSLTHKYKEALRVFERHSSLQKGQRLRGLNDLNIFTTLLNKNDEVRLHSSFIHFLLDTSANHYQNSLFLELFLQSCGVPEDFISLESARTYKEYQFIDLYITDGVSHIIIENKIYAPDQLKQLQRYIDVIKEEDTDRQSKLSDRLMVIYLSLDRGPGKMSLGRFNINQRRLEFGEESYPYKHITYDNHVMAWLQRAHAEVANITNLSVIIDQYMDVIKKMYGKYQGKVMSLHEFIESHPDKMELYRTFGEIASEFTKLKSSVMSVFWEETINRLSDRAQESGQKFGYPLRVKWNKEDIAVFAFEYHEPDYHKPMWGIFSANNPDLLNTKFELTDQFSSLPSSLTKSSNIWMKFGFMEPDNFFDWVIQQRDINTAVEMFIAQFMEVCLPCMNYIQLVNKHLRVMSE